MSILALARSLFRTGDIIRTVEGLIAVVNHTADGESRAWAARVVSALRGSNAALEAEFDRVLESGNP